MQITSKRIGILITFCLFTIALLDCKKAKDEEKVPTVSKQEEKTIIAGTGGTLVTSDSVKLVIPPGALPSDGIVFVGITGSEPSTVPNKNLEIVGKPLTLRFTSKSILKPVQLSFPRPTDPIDTSMCLIVMFNGNSYFPVEFSLTSSKVNVTIDKINWESNTSKGVKLIGDIIILIVRNKQIPSATEMGLNKVSANDAGNLSFNLPTANSTSKVLLLVHGWTGNANTWKSFIPKIIKETNPKYSEVWTFVYNSSLSIMDNAKILSSKLSTYSKGAEIDVVAHSMGGLVTRSMIEQNNGAQYINKLITLGTPHKGSPLALLRYFLGGIVFSDNPLNYLSYNYNTQGFRDLNINSKFITELNKLSTPPIKYYVIASTNDPSATPRDGLEKLFNTANLAELLPTPNDGIVSVSSAKGVPSAISPNNDFNIPVILAHLEMPNDEHIYNQVLTFLRLGKPSVLTNEVTIKTQTTAIVGGNITTDGGATITERGVYWGTSPNPETTGTKLQIAITTNPFATTLSGLTPQTLYYVKAYAVNSQGTSFGDQLSFTTQSTSPTGNSLLVFDNYVNIYSCNIDGSNITQLTTGSTINSRPRINYEKNKIALISKRTGRFEIYSMNTDGTGVQQLTTTGVSGGQNNGGTGAVDWTPDGKLIFIKANKIFKMNADGSGIAEVATAPSGNWADLRCSPNGDKIVAQTQGSWGYTITLYIMNIDGTNIRVLAADLPGVQVIGCFSRDGLRFLYSYDISGHEESSGQSLNDQIVSVQLDGTGALNLSGNKLAGSNDLYPAYSPDGSKIFFINNIISGGTLNLWVMNADGTNRVKLITTTPWYNIDCK